MIRILFALLLLSPVCASAKDESTARASEGTLSIPTYEPSGRESEPPLFPDSTVTGLYPFTTYLMPFKGPALPHAYKAIFVENEYLKLTYLPELGDRIFSVYDKIRQREVFYRNDVIKPAPYNPRNSWPQSGLELTGPHDLHTLTLHGEPFWSNKVVHHDDGSISLVLGEIDPVYGMKVNFAATLHPGVAALELNVFCYNMRDGRMPQMFWVNTAINATPKTRFIYPMSRTVGHTTADIADWPLYNGIDYSWDRNNKHMLGVFGIDIYDNFQGAYQFDRDYGIFRYADRRIVQGMKLWTFGYGEGSENYVSGYTDHAGPYVELQSGRHVWDGHYEWVAPHKVEGWSEWWIPVAKTGGLTTLTRDVALNLEVRPDAQGMNSSIKIALAATRVVTGAKLTVKASCGELLARTIDLDPATPLHIDLPAIRTAKDGLQRMIVTVVDARGNELLAYHRPDEDPGRKEYTPFTKPLEQSRKSLEQMSAEELTLAGEFQLKELNEPGAEALFDAAFKRDPGYSRAHVLLGLTDFNDGRYEDAARHLTRAIERDPYADQASYYLAMSQLALGEGAQAERNLYFIWPDSAYYGEREYQLGRFSFMRKEYAAAMAHFRLAVGVNENDLLARLALASTYRYLGGKKVAEAELAAVETIDPTNRLVQTERWFLTGDKAARTELLRLTGEQTQEAMNTVSFYRDFGGYGECARILELFAAHNSDPWGTTPEFYYMLAYYQRRADQPDEADQSLKKARAATGVVDRFPYRAEAEAPLREAIRLDPQDATARFDLACLLYFRGKPSEAIAQWEAVLSIDPRNFSARRALGLAYAAQGFPIEKAAAQLEQAIELRPSHTRTLDDLSALYARAGRFDDQLALLAKALSRSPNDDDLAEGVLTADLNKGSYREAQQLINTHKFAPRHRAYNLRDKYRAMCEGIGAQAFAKADYGSALRYFEAALHPPPSLGVDTFEGQASPRILYYIGRTYEALGEHAKARDSYRKSIAGIEQLSGDRDSWSSENFFMVFALERLGRHDEASRLSKHFLTFAETEIDSTDSQHRAEARYLLALISKYEGQTQQARTLLKQALNARPDLLAARLQLRGDALDPIKAN